MSTAVHVWTIDLDVDQSTIGSMLNLLSGDERVRAARLRTTELRLRFVAAHGAVRTILGGYLDCAPETIAFAATAEGKPFLANGSLAFNLSHSEALALCAVARSGQLGVDVERIRPVPDADEIVRRFFAPGEVREYTALPPQERLRAFFSLWTRKEALVKAVGSGLRRPLDSFEVELTPAASCPALAFTSAEPVQPAFFLRAFSPAAQYAGAVALDDPIDSVELFDFGAGVPSATLRDRLTH
jgi:4'-phosphopantetheinyl transferase